MNFQIRNTPKGDIMSMFWKEKHIGDSIGHGLPCTVLEKLKRHKCHWKYINVVIDHDIQVKELKCMMDFLIGVPLKLRIWEEMFFWVTLQNIIME